MVTNLVLRNLIARYDLPPMTVAHLGTAADLLAGCPCAACSARDMLKTVPQFSQDRPSAWLSPELQWKLYGYATIERAVTVH